MEQINTIRQKFSSASKKTLSLLLSLIMLFSITAGIDFSAYAANYNSDYKRWSQGKSSYSWMKNYGCWVVAEAKLIYETGINKSSSFNPDVYYKWVTSKGYVNNQGNVYSDNPVRYAKSLGNNKLSYLGVTTSNLTNTVINNSKNGYYSIIKVKTSSGGTHYIIANKDKTKSTGNVYIYDSWNSSNEPPATFAWNDVKNKVGGAYTMTAVYTFKYTVAAPTATCTIAYNANGGTGSMGTSTVKYNNKFTLASNSFSRTGYSFGGWNVCRKSDNKWFTTNGNGWQTAGNISSKGYTKKVYNDRWSGTLDNSWFATVKNDTYTFYAIWKKNSSTSSSTTGSQVVEYAKKFKGYPYVLNTHGPNSFDCSGFVYYVFKNFGVTLSTASSDYYNNPTKYGTKITGDSNAQLGDIVVWSGHVGIYIGSGKVINALNPSKGVCETKISEYINSSGKMNPSHFYIRVKGIGLSSSGNTTPPTVTNPSVTVNAVSDLTANSVRINFTAKNPSKVTIKTIGVQVRKKGTSDWKTKQEAMNASYTNAASVPMWWTVGSGKELNMSLTSGTTYEYRAYVIYNGKNYYSSTSTFTTKGPAPHTHNYNYVTVTIRPTCTEGGYTEYRCSCGDSYIGNYTSATGHKAVTDKAIEATCTQDGKTAGSHCSVCNAVIKAQKAVPATGHSYDTGKVTKQPTATATGIKTYTCIDCGATKKETLPATKLKKPSAKAVVNANGSFTISWGKVNGADKYDVYFDNGTGYQMLRTVTETSITTGTAHYGKKYSYKVRAVNSKNSSATSAFSAAVTATNTKRLVTPKLKAAVNANGSFTLSWNKVAGATSYQLYIKQADGSYKLMKTTNATSFTTAFATYGKQFTYKMRAVTSKNSSATSAYSSAVNAKNTKKLQTPSLKVAVNKNGSFKLSWGKVTGATSYQIYMKQANGSYKLIKTTSSTSFTTAVAAKGKTYSYKVRAVTSKNKNATSNYSNVVNAKRK